MFLRGHLYPGDWRRLGEIWCSREEGDRRKGVDETGWDVIEEVVEL